MGWSMPAYIAAEFGRTVSFQRMPRRREAALPHAPGSEKAHLMTSNLPERFGNAAQGRDPNAESHI